MAIKVALKKNFLHKDGSEIPQIIHRRHVAYEDIIDYMSRNTAIDISDIRTVLDLFNQAMEFFLPRGDKMHLPMGNYALGLRKSAKSNGIGADEPQIDASGLHLLYNPNKQLMQALKDKTEIIVEGRAKPKCPEIFRVKNVSEPELENSGRSKHLIEITGKRLSFNKNEEHLGVFLINRTNQTATRIGTYGRNGTSHILFVIPEIDPGSYDIKICTSPGGKYIKCEVYEEIFEIL